MQIFGKVGRLASEEVIMELTKRNCILILLCGLECYSLLYIADVKSLDFTIIRFLMKLFKSANMDIVIVIMANYLRWCVWLMLLLEIQIVIFGQK